MATEPGTLPAQSEPNASTISDQPIVDLVIVSPSVGVPQPLRFPGTPASTTIKQLKGKIRDALTLRPTEENQRLIHRGRALTRDGDTLLDILGADAIAADRQHTMHLVIRDVANTTQSSTQQQPTPATNSSARDSSPAPANGPQARGQNAPPEQYLNMIRGRLLSQANALNQVINQTQRERAQRGMRGIGDPNAHQLTPADARDRSPVPAAQGFPHEQGPNGRTYRAETNVRNVSGSSNGMSPADLQSIFQNADATQATLTMTNAMNNAMQRSSSSASLHSRPLTQPGVTVPMYPVNASRAGSGRTTPFSGVPGLSVTPQTGQEVYILSSPEGPRALLVNNTTAETYYTPRLSTRRSLPRMHNPAFNQMFPDFQRAQSTGSQYQAMPQYQHPIQYAQPFAQPYVQPYAQPYAMDGLRPLAPPVPQPRYQHPQMSPQPSPQPQAQQAQAQLQPQPQAQPQPQPQPVVQPAMGHGLGHPQMHPPVAAIPPLLRLLWPHLWLIFRLALFVCLFTSNGASWSRWVTIVGLAIFIFVLSTGALNGIGEHIMRPVGRHLNNLLPALDGQQGRGGNAPHPPGNPQGRVAAGAAGDHRPEQLAQRLLDERRAREGWLTGQYRRVERAGLLFLASIAPGVAERHIAHLEAEAARQRREAEEAATRAAAEAENQNNEATAEGGESRAGETDTAGPARQAPNDGAPQERERQPDAAPEPLIVL